jgi:hypothetical protein
MSDVPAHVREQLGPLVARNTYLHTLLPTEFSEPFSDDKLADIEMVAREIRVNIRRMQAMLAPFL